MPAYTFEGQTFTYEGVQALPSKELVELYNRVTGKATTKFASRDRGVKQTWSALAECGKRVDEVREDAEQEEAKPVVKKVNGAARQGRRMRFRFRPDGEIKEPKDGTKRAQLADLCRRGTTFRQIRETIGWDTRTAYEGVRLLHFVHGFGLWHEDLEDGDYRIEIVNDAEYLRRLEAERASK